MNTPVKRTENLKRAVKAASRGPTKHRKDICFVCVEVLRPSQPNWVMSSAVSLPNHTYTGQA